MNHQLSAASRLLRRQSTRRALAALVGAMLLGTAGVSAQTTFKSSAAVNPAGATNNWITAGNWTPGTTPNSATAAAVVPQGTIAFTLRLQTNAVTVNSLTFGNLGANALGVTLNAGAGGQLTFAGTAPSITNTLGDATQTATNEISAPVIINADLTVNQNHTAGALSLTGGVSGNFGLTKNGAGTLILNNNSAVYTYTGATVVNAGVLNLRNGATLGNTAAGTTVANGATLSFQGGVTIGAENTTIGGAGAAGQLGALVNVANTTNYGGTLTLTANTTVASIAGNLNLTNTAPIVGGGFALTLDGAAGGTISSPLDTSISGLTKNGAGTFIFGGAAANSYTGNTTINGGTLRLNKTAGVTALAGNVTVGNGTAPAILETTTANQIAPTAVVTLAGTGTNAGILRLTGTTQSVAGFVAGAGEGVIENSHASTAATLTVTNSTPTTFSGVIRNSDPVSDPPLLGTLGITAAGSSTLTLSGLNTYAGKTSVTSGTLIQGSATAFGASNNFAAVNGGVLDASLAGLALTAGGNLTAGRTTGAAPDIIGNVSLLGSTLEVSQPVGLVATAGTYTHQGNLTLDNSTLKVSLSNVTTVGAGVNDLVIVNGNLNLLNSIGVNITALNGPLVAGNYTLFQYTGSLTGTAAQLAQPTGLAPGRSTFSYDTTTVPGSVLLKVVGNAGNLTWVGNGTTNPWDKATAAVFTGASPDTFFDGDVVNFTDAGIANATVNLAETVSPFSVNVTSAGNYTLAGVGALGGTAILNKSGAGTLKLQTANTYTGITNVTAGALSVENPAALGATSGNTIVSSGAQVQLNNTSTAEPFALNGSGLGGTGALNNAAGANTLSGAITLQSDASIVNADSSNKLTLDVASGNAVTGAFGLTFGGAGSIDVNDPLAIGGGTLTKTGTGTLTLNGATANTNTGLTSILGGTVVFNKTTAINAIGGSLAIGNGTDPATARLAVADQIPNAATVTVNASGVLDLNSVNETFAALAGAGSVTLGSGTLTLNGATVSTFNGVISGSGGISRNAGGTLILNNVNTYTGTTNLQGNNSKIVLGVDNALPTATTVTFLGTTNTDVALDLNGKNQTIAALTAATTGDGTVYVQNNSGAGTSTLTISNGTGSFSSGNGTAIVRDNDGVATGGKVALAITGGVSTFKSINTYTGPTTISGGTYKFAANDAASSGSDFSITGTGTIDIAGFTGTLKSLTGDGIATGTSGILSVVAGNFGGTITGGIGLTKANDSASTFTLSGLANTFTGKLRSNTGVLEVYSLADSGPGSNGTAELQILNANNAAATIRYLGGATTITRSISVTANGGGAGKAILESSGTGALTINAGATRVNSGTGVKTFVLGGTNTDANTISGVIADGTIANTVLHLAKEGTGTWAISGANTYTGNTTVTAGILAVTGNGTLGTGNVIVNGTLDVSGITPSSFALAATQTLTGAGTIVATGKTVVAAGTLAPGNSPGSLDITGDFALTSTTVSNFEIAGAGAGQFDQLNVTGNILYDGTLNISTTQNTGVYDLFSSLTTSGNFAAVALTGAYTGTLTNNAGIWTGTDGVTTATFTPSSGELAFAAVAIPEPSTLVLGALGGLGFAGWGLRRRRNRATSETV